MRKKNFKGRCEKRKLPKCEDVCRTFDAVQYAYADLLNGSPDIGVYRSLSRPFPRSGSWRKIWSMLPFMVCNSFVFSLFSRYSL